MNKSWKNPAITLLWMSMPNNDDSPTDLGSRLLCIEQDFVVRAPSLSVDMSQGSSRLHMLRRLLWPLMCGFAALQQPQSWSVQIYEIPQPSTLQQWPSFTLYANLVTIVKSAAVLAHWVFRRLLWPPTCGPMVPSKYFNHDLPLRRFVTLTETKLNLFPETSESRGNFAAHYLDCEEQSLYRENNLILKELTRRDLVSMNLDFWRST